MSELLTPSPEALQHTTFIDLLSEPRAFHNSLRPGERFCDALVVEHTGNLSVVEARNSRENTQYLVIHDTPNSGLLLRRIDVKATRDGTQAREAAVLVSTIDDSRYLPDRIVPVFDKHLSGVGHDLDVDLAALKSSGQKLNETVAKEWLGMIRESDVEHSRISTVQNHERQSRIGTTVGRLFGRNHIPDARP